MAMTPTQEPADVLAYGSREDLRSDEARAEYDRLKAKRAAQGPGPAAGPPAAEPGRGSHPGVPHQALDRTGHTVGGVDLGREVASHDHNPARRPAGEGQPVVVRLLRELLRPGTR